MRLDLTQRLLRGDWAAWRRNLPYKVDFVGWQSVDDHWRQMIGAECVALT